MSLGRTDRSSASCSGPTAGPALSHRSADGDRAAPPRPTPGDPFFHDVADAAPAILWTSDAAHRCTFVSRQWRELTGQSLEESLGFGWLRVIHPDDRERAARFFQNAADRREPFQFEYRLRMRSGEHRWMLDVGRPRFGPGGDLLGYVGTVIDVNDRRRSAERVHRTGETFYQLIQNSPFGVYLIDADFRLVQVSAGAQKVFANVRPLLGRDFAEVLRAVWPEPFATEAIALFRRTLETGEPYHAPNTTERRNDITAVESYDWKIERVAMPDGRHGVVCHFYDLSERQRFEAALRMSEERYRAIVEGQAEMVCRFRPDGTILFVNGAYARARGSSPEALTGQNFWSFVEPADRPAVRAMLDRLTPDSPEVRIENRFETSDGVRWTLWTNRALAFDPARRPFEVQSVGIDITDRKRAEDALRESEERFRLVADSAPVLIWTSDPQNRAEFFNRRWTEFTGRPLEQERGSGWMEPVHPDDHPRIHECGRAIAERRPFTTQFRLRRADGVFRWIHGTGVPRFDPGGAFAGYIGSGVDINERMETEQALRESEQKLRVALEAADLGAWVYRFADNRWDLDERAQLHYNAPSRRMVHNEAAIREILHPDDTPRMWEHVRRAADPAGDGRYEVEYRVRRPDGGWRWLAAWALVEFDGEGPDRRAVRMVGASRDVTSRIQREQDLRDKQTRLRQAMRAGRMGSWEWDLPSGRVKWSPDLERIHGLEPGAFGGSVDDFLRGVHPDDRATVESAIASALDNGADYQVEYRFVPPDGGLRWIEGRGSVFRDEANRPVRMVGVCADITQRKEAEAALRASEERFRILSEVMPQLVWTSAPDGSIDYCNSRWLTYTGFTPEQIKDDGWAAALHPDDRSATFAAWKQATQSGQEYQVEQRLRAVDGTYRWFLARALPVRDASGRITKWYGTCTDIEDQRRAMAALRDGQEYLERLVHERTEEVERSHQQLRFSERMAALGTLSMGIGHDLGNLLLPIRARVDVLRTRHLAPDVREAIEAIGECAEYLQSLARGLRLFAQDPDNLSATESTTNLASWAHDTERFFRRSLPKHVALECRIPDGLPPAAIQPHRLTQAVVNLVTNAGDAMGAAGGRVRIDADHAPGEVRLIISDTGPGMSEEVRLRCLEPFFTTKVRGSRTGTGLGLSMVHGIITAAGGQIDLDSAPGRGTTFTLRLPAAKTRREDADAPAEPASVWVGDPRLRSLLLAVLGTMGYNPSPDADPADAAVWVTEPTPEALDKARSLPNRDRRILVLGHADSEWTTLGASTLDGTLNPSAIARAVQRAAAADDPTPAAPNPKNEKSPARRAQAKMPPEGLEPSTR